MLPFHETGCNISQHLDSSPHLILPDAPSCFPSTPTIFFPSDLLFPFFDGIPDATALPARPTLPFPNAAQHTSPARSARKGRQSKICTASGPRDRRMRLSIGVAQRFFQLQDMLGFDKASKTVQWLLTMSTAAIQELGSISSSSKISGDQRSPKSDSSTLTRSNNKYTSGTVSACKAKKASVKPTKKAAWELHSAKAREMRAKARERARDRTTQKQKMMTSLHSLESLESVKGESTLVDIKALLELANCKEEGNSSFASNYQCLNPNNNCSAGGNFDEQYFWNMEGFSSSYSSSMAAFTSSYLNL